ncbi:MAG: bifunctional folylpolyglutamate synthase/dihydrofolate synthase [Deltaproteobacteria bacterium]|nr:bifunctional folylpolyglutamate synthase/dihydrofolate synthase [Deltaproteobacteria bacterium]
MARIRQTNGLKDKGLRRSVGYNEAMQRIYDLQAVGMKLGLTNIRRLLNRLGNPQEQFATVLVAGTNGKGIITSSLSAVLRESGHKTGMFTSPHLIRFTERVRVDNTEISQKDLIRHSDRIWRELEMIQSAGESGSPLPVTFFEFATALACLHFAECAVDVAVMEVGLGGRLDATNAIEPVLSVVTQIDYDHEKHLGKSLEEIAREKAGIFREGVPAIALDGAPEVLESLRRVAGRVGAPLTIVENIAKVRPDKRTFDLQWYGTWLWGLRAPLPGRHQIGNASLAAVASLEMRDSGFRISNDAIRRGLATVRWPGRFERISKIPLVILDGAHNPSAVRSLVATLREEKVPEPIIPVIAVMSDKDPDGMLNELKGLSDTLVATCLQHDRSLDAAELAGRAKGKFAQIHAVSDAVQALTLGRNLAGRTGTVVVTGSLYLVGKIREVIMGPDAP